MKTTSYLEVYSNYKNYLARRGLLEKIYKVKTKHEKCVLERVDIVCEYNGTPVSEDNEGNRTDWFQGLYYIEYETTLRILFA